MYDKFNSSKFPRVGRFQLDGFTHTADDVIALLEYTPGDELKDESSLLRDSESFGLSMTSHELGAMAQVMPPGDERDYIFAIHQVVEGLNGINWNFRDVLNRALMPEDDDLFKEIMTEFDRDKREIDQAMRKVLSFDRDQPTPKGQDKVQPDFSRQTMKP